MKTLLILRHAKSSWQNRSLDDHDRPLNKRGERDAPRIGRLISNESLLPDLILSSDAKRARSTAEEVAQSSGYQGELRFSIDLYLAGADTWVLGLRALPDSFERVLIVGHNPGLETLVEMLTGEEQLMPTASLAFVELPVISWSHLELDTPGHLLQIWRPREVFVD